MSKKIKCLVLRFFPNKCLIESKDGEITEYWKETSITEKAVAGNDERVLSLWFKQGNYEINSNYVVEIEYEVKP